MIFYLDARGQEINEYIADVGDYIGILSPSKENSNLKPDDISIDKINSHLAKDEFLVVVIMNQTWWVSLIFNNVDGANELKKKYKGKVMLWYWVKRENIKFCMHNMQYKEFLKIFPEK